MAKTEDLVDQFLQAGVAAEQARQLAEKRRRQGTLAFLAIGLAVVSALAVAAGLFAFREREQRIATANQTIQLMAKIAEAEANVDPAQGVALALDALAFMQQYPEIQRAEPINALRRALAAGRRVQVLRLEMEDISDVSFSPDGHWLVAAGSGGLARWEAAGENGERLSGPDLFEEFGAVNAVAISPGAGQALVAVGRREGGVWVGDLASPPIALPGERDRVSALAWSRKGDLLASVNTGGSVRVWRRPEPTAEWAEPIRLPIVEHVVNDVLSLAFSPDGSFLAAAAQEGVALWRTGGLREGDQPPGLWVSCMDMGVSALWVVWQDETLFTGGSGQNIGSIKVAGSSTYFERWGEEVPQGLVTRGSRLKLSPSGQWFVSWQSYADDKLLRIWSPPWGSEGVEEMRGHDELVELVAFSPDERLLVSASLDGTLRVWSLVPDGREPQVYWDVGDTVAFNDSGHPLAAIQGGDNVVLSTLKSPQPAARIIPLTKTEYYLPHPETLGPQARWLVMEFGQPGTSEKDLYVWDLTRPGSDPSSKIEGQDFVDWAMTDDGRLLALANSADGSIGLWALDGEPRLSQTLPAAEEGGCAPWGLTFDAAGDLLAFACDSSVHVYALDLVDPRAGSQLLRFEGDSSNWPTSIALSADGRRLASAYTTGSVWVWEVEDPGQPPQELQGPHDYATSLAFSPDGKSLATGGETGAIYLWDLEKPGQAPQVLEGHQDSIQSLVFSADGRSLASASDATSARDRSVRVWRVDEADLVEFARRWIQP